MGKLNDDGLKSKNNSKRQPNNTHPRGGVRFEETNSSAGSEEEEEDTEAGWDDDQFIDASTMLDIGAESDGAFSDEEHGDTNSDQSSCSSDGGMEEDMDSNLDDEDEEEEDESRLEHLAEMVDNLEQIASLKRKEAGQDEPIDQATDSVTKKRKLLPVRIESRKEGEILPTSGRVNLDDLLKNLSSTPGLSELKKSLKPLTVSNDKPSNHGPLSAPLETRRQQQVERQAAYELTKKEMKKWSETTKLAQGLSGRSSDGKNRFVVATNNLSSADKVPDAARWNMHFKPSNNLEAQVVELLDSSQLTSKKLIQEENDQLITQELGAQKFKEKVVEAKLTRELMFRAERKAKRVAKIKSKAFRRIRKKEKQRKSISGTGGQDVDLGFMEELDGIDGGDRVETKKEEMEMERARERVSLKHSSQGKWAKKVAELKGLGSDRNAAIQERIRREELLKKKIQGRRSDDSDGTDQEEEESEESDFDSEASSMDIDGIKAHALNQLAKMDSRASQKSANDEPPTKGLFAMKFMQNAMATKERKANEAQEELRQQILQENQHESTEENSADGAIKSPRVAESRISDDEGISTRRIQRTTKTSGAHLRVMAPTPHSPKRDGPSLPPKDEESTSDKQINPWLALNSSSTLGGGTVSRIKDLNPNSKHHHHHQSSSIQAEKAKLKADKSKRKQINEKRVTVQDATVDINPDLFLLGEKSDADRVGVGVGALALEKMQNDDPEEAHQDAVIRNGQIDDRGRTALQQRELVKLAFADDQVVAQFHDEKQKQIQSDAPRDVDLTLPGWGDWVGKGAAKKSKANKRLIKKIEGVDPSQRKDSKLSHVIILESASVKMNNAKKLGKYQLKDVPFPYVNKNQVELGFNHPIGPEFNTRLAHRHLVRPDVLSKPGVFIRPVENPA